MIEPTNRELLVHLHDHLRAIGKDQAAQTELLGKMKREQEAQGLLLRRTFRKVGKIMSASDDIKAALADLSAETTAESDLLTAIDTKMTGLSTQIAALEQQIIDLQNNSGGLSAADVADVQASLAALKTATDANKAKEEIMANTPAPPVDPNA